MNRRLWSIALLLAALLGVGLLPALGQAGGDEPDLLIALPGRGDLVAVPYQNDVWVLDRAPAMSASGLPKALYRVDLTTQLVTTFDIPGGPQSIAAGDGAIWIATNPVATRGDPPRPVLLRIDPATADFGEIDLSATLDSGIGEVAYGAGSVWVTALGGPRRVLRIDPASREVIADIDFSSDGAEIGARVYPLAADDRAVWVVDELERRIVQIDPASDSIVAEYTLPEGGQILPLMRDLAAGEGALWYPYAVSASAREILVIDAEGEAVADSIAPTDGLPYAGNLDAYGGYVWLGANTVIYRIDPDTRAFEAVVRPSNSGYVAVSDMGIWTVQGARGPAPALARFDLP